MYNKVEPFTLPLYNTHLYVREVEVIHQKQLGVAVGHPEANSAEPPINSRRTSRYTDLKIKIYMN